MREPSAHRPTLPRPGVRDPGLDQVALVWDAEYARHVFAGAPNSTPEVVGRAVAARVERQSVLYEPGRESVFVVTEAVLRTAAGSRAIEKGLRTRAPVG